MSSRGSAALAAIFQAAERNTEAANLAEREQSDRDHVELKRLSDLATRALAGELGSDERKLATHVLLDERGRCANGLRSLREFILKADELSLLPTTCTAQQHLSCPRI
jgi:hypothetical protein